MILTRAIQKETASLAQAKGRRKLGAFMAEGTKCVLDTIAAFEPLRIIATQSWLQQHPLPGIDPQLVFEASRAQLAEITSMTLAPDVIAVYRLPEQPEFCPEAIAGKLTVALDRVQDPGNLGTIMRTADWMGIDTILASDDTVDCFNPKVIQATMGAVSRVRVLYGDLPQMLAALPAGTPVYGTFLDGANIYSEPLTPNGVLVMGNEGQGISDAVARAVSHRLFIPSYPVGAPTSESLNVATATAICLSQFRSKLLM